MSCRTIRNLVKDDFISKICIAFILTSIPGSFRNIQQPDQAPPQLSRADSIPQILPQIFPRIFLQIFPQILPRQSRNKAHHNLFRPQPKPIPTTNSLHLATQPPLHPSRQPHTRLIHNPRKNIRNPQRARRNHAARRHKPNLAPQQPHPLLAHPRHQPRRLEHRIAHRVQHPRMHQVQRIADAAEVLRGGGAQDAHERRRAHRELEEGDGAEGGVEALCLGEGGGDEGDEGAPEEGVFAEEGLREEEERGDVDESQEEAVVVREGGAARGGGGGGVGGDGGEEGGVAGLALVGGGERGEGGGGGAGGFGEEVRLGGPQAGHEEGHDVVVLEHGEGADGGDERAAPADVHVGDAEQGHEEGEAGAELDRDGPQVDVVGGEGVFVPMPGLDDIEQHVRPVAQLGEDVRVVGAHGVRLAKGRQQHAVVGNACRQIVDAATHQQRDAQRARGQRQKEAQAAPDGRAGERVGEAGHIAGAHKAQRLIAEREAGNDEEHADSSVTIVKEPHNGQTKGRAVRVLEVAALANVAVAIAQVVRRIAHVAEEDDQGRDASQAIKVGKFLGRRATAAGRVWRGVATASAGSLCLELRPGEITGGHCHYLYLGIIAFCSFFLLIAAAGDDTSTTTKHSHEERRSQGGFSYICGGGSLLTRGGWRTRRGRGGLGGRPCRADLPLARSWPDFQNTIYCFSLETHSRRILSAIEIFTVQRHNMQTVVTREEGCIISPYLHCLALHAPLHSAGIVGCTALGALGGLCVARLALGLGLCGGGLEALLKVGDDVVNVLYADADADQVGGDAGVGLLLVGQLLVGGGPGVDGQTLGVADVGQVGDELEAVDDLRAGGLAALDAKGEHAAEAAGEVLLGQGVRGVRLEAGVRDPRDVLVLLEPLGQGDGVAGVALAAQAERLGAEQQLLGGEGVQGGAQVAQDLDAHADGKGDRAKGVPELEAVVALAGLDKLGEALAVGAPVELAAVDDDAADGGAVAANPLGGRVDDNVGAVVDGAHKVAAGAKGVVDDDGHAVLVGDGGNLLKVGHVVARVADALEVDGLGLVVDELGKVVGVVAVDKLGLDAEARQEDLELVVGAAVQVAGGDDVVAGVGEGGDGHELGRLARRGGNGGGTTLERGDALLQHVDGGVHDARGKAYGGGVDGDSTRVGGLVWLSAEEGLKVRDRVLAGHGVFEFCDDLSVGFYWMTFFLLVEVFCSKWPGKYGENTRIHKQEEAREKERGFVWFINRIAKQSRHLLLPSRPNHRRPYPAIYLAQVPCCVDDQVSCKLSLAPFTISLAGVGGGQWVKDGWRGNGGAAGARVAARDTFPPMAPCLRHSTPLFSRPAPSTKPHSAPLFQIRRHTLSLSFDEATGCPSHDTLRRRSNI
ncbi:hypothetical protein FH972_026604 [Carpinus fangiana]|uniref:Uncharacterized protein n=1 Tax=Carpinus fangiana TaxID=176857 RepID=A0A5N6L4H0_9ROSI|nr:hypothetical protein FH972_026604 [Carpinus fangiana]